MMKFRINRVGERVSIDVEGAVVIGDVSALITETKTAHTWAEAMAQGEVVLRSAARTAATQLYGAITEKFRREFLRGVEEAVVRLGPEALGRGTRDPDEALTAYLVWDSSGVSIVVPETPPTPQSTQSEG